MNLGGTKPREGTKNFSKTINLTDDEVSALRKLKSEGTDVYIQQVPNESRQEFN